MNRRRLAPLNRWTEERIEQVKALRKTGAKRAEIAATLQVSENAIIGVLHRIAKGIYDIERRDLRGAPKANNFAYYASLRPAEVPFSSDSSCPDFAWDDSHCASVNALGGYPVLELRR